MTKFAELVGITITVTAVVLGILALAVALFN